MSQTSTGLILFLCVSTSAMAAEPTTTEGDMKLLVFPKEVEANVVAHEMAKKSWSKPVPLKVRLDGPLQLDGTVLRAHLLVSNAAATPYVLVVWPYGGDFPYGGTSPFRIAFSQSALKVVTYSGKRYPPEPPSPMQIVLPGKSRVRFTAELDLKRWSYDGSPTVEIAWAFHYFDGDHPKGAIDFRLPAR